MSAQHLTRYPAAHHGLGSPSSWRSREPLEPLQDAHSQRPVVSLRTHHENCKNVDILEHESLLYASGTLPRPHSFVFSKEMIRIDWRVLAGVDIESLVQHLSASPFLLNLLYVIR